MLRDNEIEMVKRAQELARIKKATTEDSIACPFYFLDDISGCRVCHKWMGTDMKSAMHPCQALGNDYHEIRTRFWRKTWEPVVSA